MPPSHHIFFDVALLRRTLETQKGLLAQGSPVIASRGYGSIITKLSRSASAPLKAAFGRDNGDGERILLIEDDLHIAQLVLAELRDAGWRAESAPTAASGITRFAHGDIRLLILDLNLPDMDGLQVCERLRTTDRVTPIMMLTARASRQDVVRGLELGADDYLTKPFDTLELIARIRALLRRARVSGPQDLPVSARPLIRRGYLAINEDTREAKLNDRSLELTAKEYELLLLFAKHPGRTFSRDELLTRVWGDGFEGYEHTVNTHINRLRSKVEKNPKTPHLIETVWGVGYRFTAAP